jgi:hypothetical protein
MDVRLQIRLVVKEVAQPFEALVVLAQIPFEWLKLSKDLINCKGHIRVYSRFQEGGGRGFEGIRDSEEDS